MDDSGVRQQTKFLADLTQAMRSTAEAARQTTLERCRAEAAAFVEKRQSGSADGGKRVRRESEEDVAAIREQSRVQLDSVRAVTEQRISDRRDALARDLARLDGRLEAELARVQDRVTQYEATLGQFFDRLLEDGDPANLARMASLMPEVPSFEESGSEPLIGGDSAAPGAPAGGGEGLPDHWWLDAPARLETEARDGA